MQKHPVDNIMLKIHHLFQRNRSCFKYFVLSKSMLTSSSAMFGYFPFFPQPFCPHHSLGDINKMVSTCYLQIFYLHLQILTRTLSNNIISPSIHCNTDIIEAYSQSLVGIHILTMHKFMTRFRLFLLYGVCIFDCLILHKMHFWKLALRLGHEHWFTCKIKSTFPHSQLKIPECDS